MCGIVGLICQDPETRIGAMLKAVEHRGRDDEGVWTSSAINNEGQRVSFGHRRLSIIDTSAAGHQPMLSPDGRLVVILNGEIYNYRELREQLTAKGHSFRTQTDTEVLLAAWAEWGEDCLSRLNGMFAFALWDDKERTLFLVRDRVGIKPLYYVHLAGTDAGAPGAIAFASEVKSILASDLIKPEVDRESLHQFLTFLWAPDPRTLFHGIKTVPPGHFVKLRDHELTVREWWDISFDTIEEGRSEAWWREQVLETLDRVVKLEMVADVPLGSFLSGGIDSSSIVALMKNHSNGRRISTYTIGIEAEDLRYDIIPDDVQWARRVNQQLDTDYHEIMLQPQVAELLPKLVYHMDEPAIDMAIPSYLVSRAARETLTVMLSGMGGDEVFAGYPRQLAMKIAGAFDPVPQLLRRPVMKTLANVLPGGMPGKLTGRYATRRSLPAAPLWTLRIATLAMALTSPMKPRPGCTRTRCGSLRWAWTRTASTGGTSRGRKDADPLNQLLYVDLKTFLPCLNLITTDKTSMAANLEVRVPFLNQHMLELTARMPPDLKLRGLRRKYILKRAAEKLLPREVVWRKKAGFGAPIRSWLRGPLRPMVDELLSEETVRRRGLFRPEEVKRIIDANLSGREDYNLQVFQLLTFELWQQAFMDR